MRYVVVLGVLAIGILSNPVFAGPLDGRWRNGSWTDDNSGHEGPLRGRFREQADGNYRVVFTGRFAKIVPFRFATTLNVVGQDGDQVVMSGESRIMGISRFTYHATADAQNFHAQYSSRRWTGSFNLNR